MDCKKFGTFIATLRKEKAWTQSELAEKLHVTDKAISKWERGLGFPDINTLQPLADTLEVSLLELMQSEKNPKEEVSTKEASMALTDVISIVEYHRVLERRNLIISIISISFFVVLILLLDFMPWYAFLFTGMPIILFIIGILSVIISIRRRKHELPYTLTLSVGIIAFILLMSIFLLLISAFPMQS